MTFKKPDNIRFVDMAIWIDEHVYTNNYDEDTLYKYLYFLAFMLAHKQKFFKKASDYDDFSLYAATHLYLRLTNPKQYKLDENNQPKLPKIKSILNYMKKTIYGTKVDFEQKYYSQVYSEPEDEIEYTNKTIQNILNESTDKLRISEFKLYLGDIKRIVKAYVKKLPHKKYSAEWDNIYLSCLLSILNMLSLTEANQDYFKRLRLSSKLTITKINQLFEHNRDDYIILYHLPKSLYNYIYVHVNNIKQILSNDLSYFSQSYVPTANMQIDLILNDIEDANEYN